MKQNLSWSGTGLHQEKLFHPVKKILFPNSSDLKIHLKMKNPAYEYLQAEKM